MLACHWILSTGSLKHLFEVAHFCFVSGFVHVRAVCISRGKKKSTYQLWTDKQPICVCVCACVCVRQIQCKLTRRLLLCFPTSRLLTASAAERWRDKQTPAATCICTAFLVFNSPQLTVSIVTGWEELKTEKDIQDIRARPPPAAGSASCSARMSH